MIYKYQKWHLDKMWTLMIAIDWEFYIKMIQIKNDILFLNSKILI